MNTQYLKTEWIDPDTGVKGYFVIDKLVNGSCGGGIRMRQGLERGEVERLARTMTYKLAVLNMPSGGAKAGIDYDPTAPDALEVLQRFLAAHKPFLLENWSTSEDLGTKEEDILKILAGMGIGSSVQAAIKNSGDPAKVMERLKTVFSLTIDGMPVTDVTTGYGVAVALKAAVEVLGLSPGSIRVAVQGFGSVGASAALYIEKLGCSVVAVADAQGTIYQPDGITVKELLPLRDKLGVINRATLPAYYMLLPREEWLGLDVDVLIPAAIADAINEENMGQVNARLIIEGANIPTTEAAERELQKRGVYVIPDFIANVGGAGLFGAVLDLDVSPSEAAIFGYLEQRIGSQTAKNLENALKHGKTVRDAAMSEPGA